MSLTAGAGTRCMSLLPQSPTLWLDRKRKKTPSAHASSFGGVSVSGGCYMKRIFDNRETETGLEGRHQKTLRYRSLKKNRLMVDERKELFHFY